MSERDLSEPIDLEDIESSLRDETGQYLGEDWYESTIRDLIEEIRCLRDNAAGRQSG